MSAGADRRLAWRLLAPTLGVLALVTVLPIGATAWESLHRHDLRLPWIGRPFVGAGNYVAALSDRQFGEAALHTALFAAVSVVLELIFGLALALALDALVRLRGLARVVVLLPWALPTVVAALVWRFMFEGPFGAAEWFTRPLAAWIPIISGDVWKSTPFVALLLLAGLQAIDGALYEAARLDGAGAWRRFREITLPLLVPAIGVAVVFRALDAVRVFDLVYVLTGGGPGTATSVLSLYAFTTMLQDLRVGYGSALSMLTFFAALALAFAWVRRTAAEGAR